MSANVFPFPGESQPKLEEFRPFYVSQLEGAVIPPRQWLVDGVLMAKTVCLLAGPAKTGKSLITQQMLTAIACGQPWLEKQVIQCRTFGMFTEDPHDEVARRQLPMNAHYGRAAADFELEMSWDAREGKDALLVEFERFSDRPQFTPLWHQLWNYVRVEGIRIVGLDTAAVVFGGKEGFRNQVTPFMRALTAQAIQMDGCVILSIHPSKADMGSYSGSTAWLASARFGMSLTRPPEYNPDTDEPRDIRVLKGLGANYGAGMRPERLEYRDGVFEIAEGNSRHDSSHRVLTLNDRIELRYRLLAGVKRVLQNGGRVPADEMHRESMPNRARRSPDAMINRIPLNDLYVAQTELIDAGQLVRVDVGRRCLLRPTDGPYYPGERIWLPAEQNGALPVGKSDC